MSHSKNVDWPTVESWPDPLNPSSGPSMPCCPDPPNPSSGPSMPCWPAPPNPSSGPSMPWPGQPNPSSGPSMSCWPAPPNPSSGPSMPWPGQPNPSSGPSMPCWPGQPNPSSGPSMPWPGQPNPSSGPSVPWPGQPNQPNLYPAGPGWSSCELKVPYDKHLPRGIYENLSITIAGSVNSDAKKITVNLCASNDIAFHFNPRFNEAGRKVIVSNSCIGGRWGSEERPPHFPFIPGQRFEMEILCSRFDYEVKVDNKEVLKFKHRKKELSSINKLCIYDDVTLYRVDLN